MRSIATFSMPSSVSDRSSLSPGKTVIRIIWRRRLIFPPTQRRSVAATPVEIGISHSFLTDWLDGVGPWHLCRTSGRTLTCRYGFWRTGRTGGIDLRIRRLGVRVPPSAPPYPQVKVSFFNLVIARTSHDPALLKPSPHLITQAVEALDAEPGDARSSAIP